MNCAPGRNGRCENVDAIPSGATTVDPRPELVVVADEPAAGEDLMSEVWECEACVGDQAAGNVREENMSGGGGGGGGGGRFYLTTTHLVRIPKCGCSLTTTAAP